ncbi:MAG: phosphoribosylformylglycinamidine cyclo-ligase [Halanaerobiaceae bacterium]
MGEEKKEGLTYSDSGVDIDKADHLVSRITDKVRETYTDGVVGDLGGFGGLFAPDFDKYEDPILVAGTDGVGTKLKIAQKLGIHDSIGIDLVAMCVNDILAQGAEPLFFLDYLACGSLDVEVNEDIITGIVEGCKQSRAALIGGETAEMPGFYPAGEYDAAGFAVGIVEREKIITGEDIKEGDLLLGLPSSGLHSNGFSLVRYLLDNREEFTLESELSDMEGTLGQELLKPTRIYVSAVSPFLEQSVIKGISHITGGGLLENIPRILPDDLQARVYPPRWPRPAIFDFIQQEGQVAREEMYRTFNMGIGLVLVVRPADKEIVIQKLKKQQEEVYNIGVVEQGSGGVILQ